MLRPRDIFLCFKKAAICTITHDGVEHAGYLAFLSMLSMFPFLVFTVAVIGFMGQGEAGAQFITTILNNLPPRVTAALQPRIVEIISGPPQGLLTISILGAIWTASSAVEGLRTILNRAYHVATPPAYWFRRSLSVLQLLFFTFILVLGMLLVIAIPLILKNLEEWLGFYFISEHQQYWSNLVFLGSVFVLFGTVSYIYYIIPNIRQRFISVAPGAAMVVVLWLLAAHLFTLYLSNFQQVNLIYGSLGGVIAALLFFYICNMIFIFGAEFNYQVMHLLDLHLSQREDVDGDVPEQNI